MFDLIIYTILIIILIKEYKRIKTNDKQNKETDEFFMKEVKKQTEILEEIQKNTNIYN